MTTRGLTLLNPMNLMTTPAFTWKGELKPTTDPDGRLCQFDNITDGIRAGALNLLAYNIKDGCKTIRQIITRYAPASENPTDNYIAFISDWVGVDSDEQIDLATLAIIYAVISGIIHFEQGANACKPAQIQQGITEALESFKVA